MACMSNTWIQAMLTLLHPSLHALCMNVRRVVEYLDYTGST